MRNTWILLKESRLTGQTGWFKTKKKLDYNLNEARVMYYFEWEEDEWYPLIVGTGTSFLLGESVYQILDEREEQ